MFSQLLSARFVVQKIHVDNQAFIFLVKGQYLEATMRDCEIKNGRHISLSIYSLLSAGKKL